MFPSSIELQKKYAEQFDNLAMESTRLESIYQKKLASLAELKQSLLQKAFSGELTASAATSDTIAEEAAFA